jgi:hypothetical protein
LGGAEKSKVLLEIAEVAMVQPKKLTTTAQKARRDSQRISLRESLRAFVPSWLDSFHLDTNSLGS